MRFDMVLNQPDAGEISVNLNDAKAVDITDGRLIKMVYRGAPIGSGGFFVENIVDDKAASGDRAGQWKKVSGRGGLAILDDGIIYPVTDETSRTFTAVTMGSILLTLINEAKARGCFPNMRTEFSETQDSKGDLWTDSTTITLQVGTSLLDVARQFSELGLEFKLIFDWYLGDFALFAYGSALGTDKSATAVVRIGQNAEQVSESKESSALKNAYLVSYQAGMTNTSDAVSIAAYRRREAYFQASNAPSSGSALVLANAELAAKKDPIHSISVKLNDGANPPKYGVDYDLGDWIGVDFGNGLANSIYRIRGISLDWPVDKKYASITLTLNSIKLEQELLTAIAMRKIANGSLGGGTSGVSPDGNAAVDAHDADNSAHTNRPLSGDLAGTVGTPIVAKLRGVALKNPLTVSTRQSLQYNPTSHELEMADTPAHANTHTSGAGDAIKLDDLAAPDDNTDLDASTVKHGLMKKFPGGTADFLRADGAFAAPSGSGLGDVVGPASSVNGHLVVFDGTTGKLIADGGTVPSGGGLWSPDTPPSSPNTEDDEFNSSTLNAKWTKTSTAANDDVNTTWPSAAYANFTGNQKFSLKQNFAPAGAFSLTACFYNSHLAAYQSSNIYVFTADEANSVRLDIEYFTGNDKAQLSTRDNGTWTYSRSSLTVPKLNKFYLHLQRNSSNLFSCWISFDGRSFSRIGTYSKTMVIDHFTVEVDQAGATIPVRAGIDWVRRDWITL